MKNKAEYQENLLTVKQLNLTLDALIGVKMPAEDEPEHLLYRLDLQIDYGQTIGIVGDRDAGKTLLAKALCGLLPVQADSIIFNGHDIGQMSYQQLRPVRADINMLWSDSYNSLNPHLTCRENIIAPLVKLNDMTGIDYRLAEIMEKLTLDKNILEMYPRQLSADPQNEHSGLYQLICLARGIITRPKLLIIDDVTAELNMSAEAMILDLLYRLSDDMHFAILLLSRDARIMQPICDKIHILDRGEIVESAPTSKIMFNPKSVAGKKLIDNALIIK